MFTGIIETVGEIKDIRRQEDNLVFAIASSLAGELKIDQSLSHNGACLTVTAVSCSIHEVVAIAETLDKTNLKDLKTGDAVNLERAMKLQDRLDGHLVQGHVDTTGECMRVENKKGSHEYRFAYPPEFASLVIEKGSICLNGVSLTVYDLAENRFSVSLIPYTLEHTNLRNLKTGDRVNIEFDLLGKYVVRRQEVEEAIFQKAD